MAKKKVVPALPTQIYVQQVIEEGNSYLLAYDDVNDIDLDQGSIVGIYDLFSVNEVSDGPRIVKEVD